MLQVLCALSLSLVSVYVLALVKNFDYGDECGDIRFETCPRRRAPGESCLAPDITSFPWVVPLGFLGYSIEAVREKRVLQKHHRI